MLVVGEPTPRPEIPIEGAEMIVPLICIGAFFLLVFGFFAWFFLTMNREDEAGKDKQDRMLKSPVLKGIAKGFSVRHGGLFFPKSFGKWRQ